MKGTCCTEIMHTGRNIQSDDDDGDISLDLAISCVITKGLVFFSSSLATDIQIMVGDIYVVSGSVPVFR